MAILSHSPLFHIRQIKQIYSIQINSRTLASWELRVLIVTLTRYVNLIHSRKSYVQELKGYIASEVIYVFVV